MPGYPKARVLQPVTEVCPARENDPGREAALMVTLPRSDSSCSYLKVQYSTAMLQETACSRADLASSRALASFLAFQLQTCTEHKST